MGFGWGGDGGGRGQVAYGCVEGLQGLGDAVSVAGVGQKDVSGSCLGFGGYLLQAFFQGVYSFSGFGGDGDGVDIGVEEGVGGGG